MHRSKLQLLKKDTKMCNHPIYYSFFLATTYKLPRLSSGSFSRYCLWKKKSMIEYIELNIFDRPDISFWMPRKNNAITEGYRQNSQNSGQTKEFIRPSPIINKAINPPPPPNSYKCTIFYLYKSLWLSKFSVTILTI